MALYKYASFLAKSEHAAFDDTHEPGNAAAYAGIYRCVACGHEIGIAEGHKLPPQNHHQHASGVGKIAWKLIVYANHGG